MKESNILYILCYIGVNSVCNSKIINIAIVIFNKFILTHT